MTINLVTASIFIHHKYIPTHSSANGEINCDHSSRTLHKRRRISSEEILNTLPSTALSKRSLTTRVDTICVRWSKTDFEIATIWCWNATPSRPMISPFRVLIWFVLCRCNSGRYAIVRYYSLSVRYRV